MVRVFEILWGITIVHPPHVRPWQALPVNFLSTMAHARHVVGLIRKLCRSIPSGPPLQV